MNWKQHDLFAVDYHLTCLTKVDRYAPTDIGLDLSDAPLWRVWMPDKHSRLKYRIQFFQGSISACGGSMMTDRLAALVGSRICHDLISPIGAIGNGVELLSLTDGDTSAEMALISESVESASARIRFFRIAFGSAAPEQVVSRGEVMVILSANARGGRFNYLWQPQEPQSRLHVRVAFLLLLCCESALPMGGDIDISVAGDVWTITAQGSRIAVDPALWDGLAAAPPHDDVTPAQVHFALLRNALTDAGRTLSLDVQEDRIVATF